MTNSSQAGPAIALAGVNLSLGQGAARVHILKDIDLHIGSGEAIGLVGPSGSGKSTLLMVMAGLERADTGIGDGRRREPRRPRRGRAGALPRPPCRHRIPVVSSDPDHDGAGKCRRAAGIGRRSPTRMRSARDELAAVGLSDRLDHYPAAIVGRRAAARGACPRACAQSGDPRRRRADRQSGRGDGQADHRSSVRRPRQREIDARAGHARPGARRPLRPRRAAALGSNRRRGRAVSAGNRIAADGALAAAALRVARTARRLARLLRLHRLHRARRHGDCRRRLARGEPCRRPGARRPRHPWRRPRVLADPARSNASRRRHSSTPTAR